MKKFVQELSVVRHFLLFNKYQKAVTREVNNYSL